MPHALPPYALIPPVFRFRHLANLAGRAPIGGAREVALACFVSARLTAECMTPADDGPSNRAARCAGAKAWLSTLALPATVRTPATRCADLSVQGLSPALVREFSGLAAAAGSFLDQASRGELDALSATLRG